MALIKCENVSIGYEGQTIVRDLNFEIGQGDYLCIVGENGSGKMYPPEMHGRSLLHKLYPNMEASYDIRFRLRSHKSRRYHTSSALPIILFQNVR